MCIRDRLGLGFDEAAFQQPVSSLSGGQRSKAAMARLLLSDNNLLLLDEPTNHLDIASVEWLEDYLRAWPGAVSYTHLCCSLQLPDRKLIL